MRIWNKQFRVLRLVDFGESLEYQCCTSSESAVTLAFRGSRQACSAFKATYGRGAIIPAIALVRQAKPGEYEGIILEAGGHSGVQFPRGARV